MTIAVSWNRDVPRRSSGKKEAPPQKPATEVAVSSWNRCSGVIGGSKRVPVLFCPQDNSEKTSGAGTDNAGAFFEKLPE